MLESALPYNEKIHKVPLFYEEKPLMPCDRRIEYLCGRSIDHRARGGDSLRLSWVHLWHRDTRDCLTISLQGLYQHILWIHLVSLHGELFLETQRK